MPSSFIIALTSRAEAAENWSGFVGLVEFCNLFDCVIQDQRTFEILNFAGLSGDLCENG